MEPLTGEARAMLDAAADPDEVAAAVERVVEADGTGRAAALLAADGHGATALVAVLTASRAWRRALVADPELVEALGDLDAAAPPPGPGPAITDWYRGEELRVTARDLLGLDPLEATMAAMSRAWASVLQAAVTEAEAESLCVVAMGKLGGSELNYRSDVDLVLVGRTGDQDEQRAARRLVAAAARTGAIDTALRPEGRDGALVRSLDGFVAHWRGRADAWELQALLKARPIAGDLRMGERFSAAAADAVWARRFGADDLRALRSMKARTEADALAGGDGAREIKRGPGGIRDVEFSVQLLQLVHGANDPSLRVRGTLPALTALAGGGYVDAGDAHWLAASYRFLRRVEHAVQVDAGRPRHAVPAAEAERERLARTLGFRPTARARAVEAFDRELGACRATVRAAHERLYFRPLLEAFAGTAGVLSPEAAADRLSAFGFTDAARTRQAVGELSSGLNRSSRLMQQMLPLLLDWLSQTPDPDAGLLGLRHLVTGPTRATAVTNAFRDSPEAARRLCRLVGTSTRLTTLLARNPDMVEMLASAAALDARPVDDLVAEARTAVGLRTGTPARRGALHRFTDREGLRIAASDVLRLATTPEVEAALSALAESAVRLAVAEVHPTVPLAVIALGRFGGRELSYASDLDLVLVHGGTRNDQGVAERDAARLVRFLAGDTPADLVYDVDLDLRPEGRNGPIVRSLEGYQAYMERWARPWERQALLRARPVAGDTALASRFLAAVEPHVWAPLSDADRREIRRVKARVEAERIPPGEDPDFHLKLGPGALADVEFCAQMLQLSSGVRAQGTVDALDALERDGALARADADVLRAAYRFCERTRNRWFLVKGSRSDSLPTGDDLARLARALDTTPGALREDYRRTTRRSRRVVERLFYDIDGG